MSKVILIKAEGVIHIMELGNDILKHLQAAVGGYIEVVPVPEPLNDVYMVCNEEGKLNDLPYNVVATLVYNYGRDAEYIDPIVGDAVIVKKGRDDLEGLEEKDVDRILPIIKEMIKNTFI